MGPGIVLGLVISGCADVADTDATSADDTAAMTWSTDAPEPLLTNEDIAGLLEALAATGAPNGYDISMDWLEHLAHGDESCPGDEAFLDRPAGACTTAAGWYYEGIGWYEVTEAEMGAGGELVELSYYNGGDFVILSPWGARFAGGGELRVTTTDEGDARTTVLALKGSWIDEDRQDWLGQGFSAVFDATLTETAAGAAMTVSGGLSVGELNVYLDDLRFGSAATCPEGLAGALRVRDVRGYWSTWELGEDCDACGTVTFHEDQDQGELCLDLGDWADTLLSANAPR